MKLTEIILSEYAPQNLRAVWLQPQSDNTIAFKVFNNGMWMNTFEWQDLSGFLTKTEAADTYQPIGDYATKSWVTQQGYLTSIPEEYVTDSELSGALGAYVTTESLGITLSGYLTLDDAQLKYQPKGDYATSTALTEGLALKEDTFTPGTGLEMTPERVLNVTLDTTVFKVVSSLPAAPDAGDENKIFLVPAESTGPNNAYTEYLWVNSAWEELGQYISEVDLTPYLKIVDAQSTYATKTELTAHTGNTSNPHNVTKAQVGLGNVDNTSDANKPVSTAQQAAINAVDNKTAVYTVVPELTADYTIPANATTREYIYEISIGATTYNVTAAEGIKWIDNNLPFVEANSKLVVSVVNNIAVWGTVYE